MPLALDGGSGFNTPAGTAGRTPALPSSMPPPASTPAPARAARAAGSCRQCAVGCERVVHPAGCLQSGCPRLYSHHEDGRTWVGCLEGVYRVEIDLGALRAASRSRAGFGALRAHREPLAICRADVERTFAHRTDEPCVNPDFLLSAPRRPYVVRAARRPG